MAKLRKKIRRYRYNMSHETAVKGKIGCLIPFDALETSPLDTWSGSTGLLLRFAPMKRPYMMALHLDAYYFYVPHRLTWDGWEDFITRGPDAGSKVPSISIGPQGDDGNVFSNLRYYRNTGAANNVTHSSFRIRAYNLVCNEFFRDDEDTLITPDSIFAEYETDGGRAICGHKKWYNTYSDKVTPAEDIAFDTSGATLSAQEVLYGLAQQKAAMRRSMFGTRYVDHLKYEGVNVNYQMLQRPELVARAHRIVNSSDVLQTTGEGTAKLGDYAGYNISGGSLRLKRKSFPEHGTLLGVLAVRPEYYCDTQREYLDAPAAWEGYYDSGLVNMPPVALYRDDIKGGAVANVVAGYTQWGEWYRGASSWSNPTLQTDFSVAPSASPWTQNRRLDPSLYDSLFDSSFPDTAAHFRV